VREHRQPGHDDLAARIDEQRERDPPRFADRGVTARERDRANRRAPAVAVVAREQDLGAPRGAVRAPAGAVVGDADHRSGKPVLRHRARDVRVMMLHRDAARRRSPARVLRGGIRRMQIVRDDLGTDVQDLLHARDRRLEEVERRDVLQVADVWTEVRAVAGRDAERVLELRPDREHRPLDRTRERDRARHVTARSAQQGRRAGDHARDRIVAARRDRAVVHDDRVRDRSESGDRFGVVGADRLVRRIRRRHHERPARGGEHQVVKRRVRQHEPDELGAGRDLGCDRGRRTPRYEHDRSLRCCEERGLVAR
jgi:hypothetical protein